MFGNRFARNDLQKSKRAGSSRRVRLAAEALEDRTLLTPVLLGAPAWQAEGPSPINSPQGTLATPDTGSGAVESVVVAKSTGQTGQATYTVYAATVNGGVWKSDNITDSMFNGQGGDPSTIVWTPVMDSQPTLAISSLALDPGDKTGNTLWAGTGSLSSAFSAGGPAIGLLETTNGGASWNVLGNKDLAGQTVLRVVPTGHTDTVANGGGEDVIVATQKGIWWSGDGGQTFQNGTNTVTNKPLTGNAIDIAADPRNPGDYYAALIGQGLFWSSDYGKDWQPITSNNSQMTNSGNMRIAIDGSAAPSILWVVTVDPTGKVSGLFRGPLTSPGSPTFTQDGPQSGLTVLNSFPTINSGPTGPMLSLTFDPTDPIRATAYVGTNGQSTTPETSSVYVASSGNWVQLTFGEGFNPGQPHPDSRSLTILNPNLSTSTLLETDDGGIYALNQPNKPGAASWVSLVGNLAVTEFFSAFYDPKFGIIDGGAQDVGTPQQSTANAAAWDILAEGEAEGDGGGGALDSHHSGHSLIYFYEDGQLETAFNSNSTPVDLAAGPLFPMYSGLSTTDQSFYTGHLGSDISYPIAVDQFAQGSPEPLLFGMFGIYESPNTNGNTIVNVTPVANGEVLSTGRVQAISYGASNSPLAAIYSTNTGDIFLRNSLASGSGFAQVSPTQLTSLGWPDGDVANKIIFSADYHTVFILDSRNNVWKLVINDFGQNTVVGDVIGVAQLTNITGNLSSIATVPVPKGQGNENLQSLDIYDPTPGTNILLVGGLGGVYRGFPSGNTYVWSLYGTGLPNVVVNDLHYVPFNANNGPFGNVLLAATLGRGAWIVPMASATLGTPPTLSIVANAGDTIRLEVDSGNSSLLDVFVDNSPAQQFPLSEIGSINVDGTAGNVTLIVDESNGIISLPNPLSNTELTFNAASTDTLEIDDSHSGVLAKAALDSDTISGLAPLGGISEAISYSNLGHLQFKSGLNPNDTVTLANNDPVVQTEIDTSNLGIFVYVQQTAGPVTINSGGPDEVTVGATANTLSAGSLANILAPVSVLGTAGISERLEVDDEGDITSANSTWSVEGPFTNGDNQPVNGQVRFSFGAFNAFVNFNHVTILVLDGGSAGTTFQLSPNRNILDTLPATIGINGAATTVTSSGTTINSPTNTLILDDQNSADSNMAWSVTGFGQPGDGIVSFSSSSVPSSPTITFFNINHPTTSLASLIINGGRSGNHFKISPKAEDLDELPLHIAMNGGGASDIVDVNDQKNANASTWSMAGGTVIRKYQKTSDVSVTRIVDVSNVGTLNVNAGAPGTGINSFALGSATADLDVVPGQTNLQVTLTTGGASNRLNLLNTADPNPEEWDFNKGSVVLKNTPSPTIVTTINFSNSNFATLSASGGPNGSAFRLSRDLDDLDDLVRTINITGDSAADGLYIVDGSNANPATWTVTNQMVTRVSSGTTSTVNYSHVLFGLNVFGGTGGNTFYVPSTAAGTPTFITGSIGNTTNTFDAGSNGTSAGNLKGIVSSLTLSGQNEIPQSPNVVTSTLLLDDSGDSGHWYNASLTSTAATAALFGSGGSLSFSNFHAVTLNTSTGSINTANGPLHDGITVTPTSGMVFTVNGDNFFESFPVDTLTVSTANGGVTNVPSATVPHSGFFYFSSDSTQTAIVNYTGMRSEQPTGWLVTAPDAGHSPEVKVFNAQSGALRFDITAFDPGFEGGVRVAVGDLNGDGIPDIIAAKGPGDTSNGDSLVHVYDGITGDLLTGPLGSFDPFPGYHGGLYVAAADLTGSGFADLIVGQDAGGQGWVKVYSGQDGSLLEKFQPFGPYGGGVRLAAGPVGSDGQVDVVAGAGPGGPPLVEVFDGPNLLQGNFTQTASFNAFDASFTGGVYIATGLIHGQGQPPAEIIVGEGAGGEPRVSVFDGAGTQLQSFLAFPKGFQGGVRVAAADVNGDGRSDIVAAKGPGGGPPEVLGFDGVSLQQIDDFFAYSQSFHDGLFVGGGGKWGLFNPNVPVPSVQTANLSSGLTAGGTDLPSALPLSTLSVPAAGTDSASFAAQGSNNPPPRTIAPPPSQAAAQTDPLVETSPDDPSTAVTEEDTGCWDYDPSRWSAFFADDLAVSPGDP